MSDELLTRALRTRPADDVMTELCWHKPVEVRTLVTDELVGHLCSRCLRTCAASSCEHGETIELRSGEGVIVVMCEQCRSAIAS